ncbi:transglycosylase domain-containing protein [Streptosporangium sp. NBC_01756]|uniref:transglycosylase domain-containing protein n=1 Tax=Streptosporangium sp. NBC_01756 TaxID=2975950 RepID=UPI002DD89906|nr:transglycosylase domain-containing protein [Streptosporangium sp. NBC_01756]WSC90207.1 transglycosylase domain-containing protein [Streptosporangium sp. NBC_01756]
MSGRSPQAQPQGRSQGVGPDPRDFGRAPQGGGRPPQGAGRDPREAVRPPQAGGPAPRAGGQPPQGAGRDSRETGVRRQDTDPAGGRRPEAAFEDTQAMLAAQARSERASGAGPGGRRRARGGRGAGGPGPGPEGQPGSGGPGGPGGRGPEDEDEPDDRGWKRFLPNWKIVVASFTVLAAGVFGMIAVAYANTPVPANVQADANDRGSVIYYADGKTAIARMGTRRTPVTIDKIPDHVQDAVIALENKTFRTDSGIDFGGIARSVWSTATGAQLQGASTITQQMARNYYDGLSKDVSIKRKVMEIFVSIKISKTLPKDEILSRYLNTIYFGRGAYGIQAAAKVFFGKDVWKLTPPEAAYLAGRIQNPTSFDILEQKGNFAATKERYTAALRNMAEMNPGAYGKYAATPFEKLKFEKVKVTELYRGLRGYMLNIVEKELARSGITKKDLETEGLKVYTTFDKKKMEDAQKVVQARTANLEHTIHASIASVNPKNGRVVAFYSGDDFLHGFNNRAFESPKQAASAFKPYVLAAWLEAGYSLDSYVDGVSKIKMPGTTEIGNSHVAPYGPINMVKAMADSVNTVFAQMGEKVGLENVAKVAKEAGVGEEAKKNAAYRGLNAVDYAVEEQKYQTTIGVASVTPVEQAAGYSIFANEGKHTDWHTVIKVVRPDGVVAYREQAIERQVISPEAAADSIVALQAVVKTGTGTVANLGVRPVAGKTGTNNSFKDAWFVGFTPQLVTAVGMSKDVPYNKPPGAPGRRPLKVDKYGQPSAKAKSVAWAEEPMPSFIGGGGTPTQIWHDYMALATAKDPVEQFPPRANAGQQENLATPKPTPSPTPTPDPFDTDGPGDDSWPDDTGDQTTTPDDQSCVPGDITCDTSGEDTGVPEDLGGGEGGGDIGNAGGVPDPGFAPESRPGPSGRRP